MDIICSVAGAAVTGADPGRREGLKHDSLYVPVAELHLAVHGQLAHRPTTADAVVISKVARNNEDPREAAATGYRPSYVLDSSRIL